MALPNATAIVYGLVFEMLGKLHAPEGIKQFIFISHTSNFVR